jgi:hypothetical protein
LALWNLEECEDDLAGFPFITVQHPDRSLGSNGDVVRNILQNELGVLEILEILETLENPEMNEKMVWREKWNRKSKKEVYLNVS